MIYPLTIRTYAKINLTLEVLGKRSDGYHEIVSILQTVGLEDVLSFLPSERLSLAGDLCGLPPEDNLVFRAAQALQRATMCDVGVAIRLEKAIPLAAGLGGGSSDAAAALRGLNAFWGLKLGQDALRDLAQELGSDVPFFLMGGTALAQGRGEVIAPLPDMPEHWVVLLCPEIEVEHKTRKLYTLLCKDCYTDGKATQDMAGHLRHGEVVFGMMHNVFEAVAPSAFPGFEQYKATFQEAGAERVHLSGSGPSLFALFSEGDEARNVAERLCHRGLRAYVAKTVRSYKTEAIP